MMKTKNVTIVVCRPSQRPTTETLEITNTAMELWHAEQLVGGSIETVPYPRQLKQPKLSVVVNENALNRNRRYNRWGLAGNFFVTRFDVHGRLQTLSPKAAEQVLHDLKRSVGYLDAASGVNNFFREEGMDREPPPDPFFFINPNWRDYFRQKKTRRSLPAEEFESQGGEWTPQLHFTGVESMDELQFIESLLNQYAAHIVAHDFSFPLPGAYSVELQFGSSEKDHSAMIECRQRYLKHFKDKDVENDTD